MTNDSKLISIIAHNAIEESRRLRRHFLHGDITFEQVNQSTLSLRNMLMTVGNELDRNNILDEADAIGTALREIRDIRDLIYEYKAKIELYEINLRKELREQIKAEQRRA